jgi:ABC transport system ATP-binding/permease protein
MPSEQNPWVEGRAGGRPRNEAASRAASRNLLNLERVSKSYGVRPLLTDVSLGVAAGERIGVVGRNGDGKTTLLNVMTGLVEPDSGRVSRQRGLLIGHLRQHDELLDTHTVREAVLAGRSDHEWAADPRTREVVEVLLAGVALDRAVAGLSGGERRRCSLAALLLDEHDLVVLDEPTNHLDVEAVAWLADHLARRTSALVVVTHDRWFLDAVCQWTWEVHDGAVDVYEGGYASYVLAQAERQRQAAASELRRRNLVRKELAWLRRGPPARTSKPKFRIDAANDLIEDVPAPRDRLALQRFASQRLGKDVIDMEDVDLERGERVLLSHATWRLGPGDRVGLVGVNGAGKTSVLNLLAGELAPSAGRVRHGRTVALAHLSQHVDDIDPEARVLATVESIRRVTRTADGEVTATSMLERFGFTGDKLTARLGDLSGGERRRFQLLRLLLSEPNVLLLDEPTNDLDIETLTVVEDFLDGWPGTLVVVSHDRYFLERTVDTVWALLDDGQVSMLPRGVEEYLERRQQTLRHADPSLLMSSNDGSASQVPPNRPRAVHKAARGSAEEREARKAIARIERQLERVGVREAELHAAIVEAGQDYERLTALSAELDEVAAERDTLELEWLEVAEALE